MLAFLFVALVCVTPANGDSTYQYEEILVELELDDSCWYYKSEDPVLTCTAHSLDGTINWRRDDLIIGLGSRPVGSNISQYNISSDTNNILDLRQERLHLSSSIAMSSIHQRSAFRCENQGFSSSNVYLTIPDCDTCQSCPADTGDGVSETERLVELRIEDPCWFYKSEDPVLDCTVHPGDGAISWRRGTLLVGIDGTPVGNDVSLYNITSVTTESGRQERLRLSRSIAMSFAKEHCTIRCENHGSSSRSVNLQNCGDCQSCTNVVVTDDSASVPVTSGRMIKLPTSGKSTELSIVIFIIVVATGTLTAVGAASGVYIYRYLMKRDNKAMQVKGDLESSRALHNKPNIENGSSFSNETSHTDPDTKCALLDATKTI